MTKKRIAKRFMALVATAMLMVGMVIPAMASSVTYANTGTITVHKYSGNQEGVIPNNTGSMLDPDDADHPLKNGYKALEGAEFTLYKVDNLDDVMAKLRDNKTITSTAVVPGEPPSVKYTFSDGSEITEVTSEIDSGVTTAAGLIQFGAGDLLDGVYVLVETDTPEDHYTAAPSIIRLPLTNEDGEYNYDVHVYPKNVINSEPAKKDIVGVTKPVSTNDVIRFELKAKFLSDTVKNVKDLRAGEGPYTYGAASITETFNTYFALEASPAVGVYWLDADGNITTSALATTDYTISTLPTGAGGSFTVTLKEEGIDAAIDGNKVGFGVTLSAKYVGGSSVDKGDTANRITNPMRAYVEAATDGPGGGTTTTDTAYVPSIAIKVVNEKSNNDPLPGVTFALATVPVPRVNLEPGKPLASYTTTEQGWIEEDYVIGANGEPLVEVTDGNGLILYSNLNGYDNDEGATFYLKQLETVPGFKLRIPAIEVKFKDKDGYEADHSDWFDASGNWLEGAYVLETVTVINYELDEEGGGEEPGFSLPLTGGAGTVIFTVAGILVMLGAAVLIVRKRKEA